MAQLGVDAVLTGPELQAYSLDEIAAVMNDMDTRIGALRVENEELQQQLSAHRARTGEVCAALAAANRRIQALEAERMERAEQVLAEIAERRRRVFGVVSDRG